MKKYLIVTLLILAFSNSFGQQTFFDPIDTVVTSKGTMLIYGDRTWTYMGEEDFEGIMNLRLHEMVSSDSIYNFKSYWLNNEVITCRTNDVSSLKDTVWMCVLDSLHDTYAIPYDGIMTSKFGYRKGRPHNGVDISLNVGDTIYAAFNGKIRYSQYHNHGYGNLVVIRHYNGLETYYGHASKLLVVPNQDVKAGDPIALGGNTGRSTGPHLHFEVRFYDNPIDPELIFDFKQNTVKDNLLVHSDVFSLSSRSTGTSANIGGPSAGGSTRTHKVRSGESLGLIARKHGTSVSKICQLNGMKATDIIHIGQVLKVR